MILQNVKKVLDIVFAICYNVITEKRKGVNKMNIAYVRVSTIEQNEARQIEALEKYNINKWFIEKVSAKDTNRPQLQELLEFVREGDTVYIHDFSRLARSTKDLLDITEHLEKKNVVLVSNKENIDTSYSAGKLMMTMLGAIAEFERENMLERQREGIAIAKREGKFKGGKVKKIDENKFSLLLEEYNIRKITKSEFAEKLGVSRPTLDKLLKEREAAAK